MLREFLVIASQYKTRDDCEIEELQYLSDIQVSFRLSQKLALPMAYLTGNWVVVSNILHVHPYLGK